MRAASLVVLFLGLLGACRTVRQAGECEDARSVPCLTERVCSEDRVRGCMVCQCAPPFSRDQDPRQSTYPRPQNP